MTAITVSYEHRLATHSAHNIHYIHCHPLYYVGMVTVTNKATPPRKTKPKGRHPYQALAAAFVRTAPPGRHADGNGLYLFVQPSGTRSWIQRLVIRGRRRELGLGSVALVSLAEAGKRRWPTVSWPARAATRLPRSVVGRAYRASPKPPRVW